jgi:hypothetical protein
MDLRLHSNPVGGIYESNITFHTSNFSFSSFTETPGTKALLNAIEN